MSRVPRPAVSPEDPGSVESLYPFLYSGTTDLQAVLDQVRQSTVAKVQEIDELRRVVGEQDGARLMSCASQAASRSNPSRT